MRISWFALVVLLVGGCFGPRIENGGFACSPTDDPPCPSGFYCVDGLCLDHLGAPGGGDAAVGAPADLGSADLAHGGADLAHAPADLASPPDLASPADLAPAPPDLACFDWGHECHGKQPCCSECCSGSCNWFGECSAF